MKSALSIIAFSKSDPTQAITALLEVALEALDRAGYALPAAHVDMGLNVFLKQSLDKQADVFDGMDTWQ